jgi:chaperonin cofactor prefoldin
MFKKFLSLFVTLLLLVGGAGAAETRIWEKAASSGFPSFYKGMETNGWTAPNGISVEGLTIVAFEHAKKQSLANDAEWGAFAQLFRQRNKLSGEYITTEQFIATGKDVGFFVGSLTDMRQALGSGGVAVSAAPAVAPVTAPNENLRRLEQEVLTLNKKEGKSAQEIAMLRSKLDELNAAVLAERNRNAALTAASKKQLAAVEASVDSRVKTAVKESVAPLQATTATAVKQIEELQKRFQPLEQLGAQFGGLVSAVNSLTTFTMVGFALTLLAFASLAYWQRKMSKGVKAQAIILTQTTQAVEKLGKEVASNRSELRLEQAIQGGRLNELSENLCTHLKELTEKDDELETKVKVSLYGQARLNEKVRNLAEEVTELQAGVPETSGVQFAPENLGVDELAELPIGREHAASWLGQYDGKCFTVKIWREANTPVGLVQTNIVRNQGSAQTVEPLALKRLKARVVAAVLDGRVPLIARLSIAA